VFSEHGDPAGVAWTLTLEADRAGDVASGRRGSSKKGMDSEMSQRSVEWILGRLVTDEGFRRRFWESRESALGDLSVHGCPLNECERRALLALSETTVEKFAESIDPRIQKSDLKGGEW
jgi:hypothetical protein